MKTPEKSEEKRHFSPIVGSIWTAMSLFPFPFSLFVNNREERD